jgi:hypothetical protein
VNPHDCNRVRNTLGRNHEDGGFKEVDFFLRPFLIKKGRRKTRNFFVKIPSVPVMLTPRTNRRPGEFRCSC